MKTIPATLSLLTSALLLAGCGSQPSDAPATQAASVNSAAAVDTPSAAAAVQPADEFMAGIARHCWQSFAGRIVANEPADPADPFIGKPLVMHVRECGEGEIKIPFHVGDDHSRTWALTRTSEGLRLKHDHRHEDGTDDATTMYGGDTASAGTAQRQEFPVDAFSIELFEREGRSVSTTNVWAMEIEPGQRFVYELARPGRLFRVEFDLTTQVETPPVPWGHK